MLQDGYDTTWGDYIYFVFVFDILSLDRLDIIDVISVNLLDLEFFVSSIYFHLHNLP